MFFETIAANFSIPLADIVEQYRICCDVRNVYLSKALARLARVDAQLEEQSSRWLVWNPGCALIHRKLVLRIVVVVAWKGMLAKGISNTGWYRR
jgi:hypothetical protein